MITTLVYCLLPITEYMLRVCLRMGFIHLQLPGLGGRGGKRMGLKKRARLGFESLSDRWYSL